MSFSPLPTALLTDLGSSPGGVLVELGCGDGRFTRVLREAGAHVVAADRSRPCVAPGPLDLCADAERPPLRGVDGLIAANLLRHLWTDEAGAELLSRWCDCLAPGGRLWILEDEPATEPGPADTYRRLQDWLARVVPWRRGLLPRARVEAVLDGAGGGRDWSFGARRNLFAPPDPADVVSLLKDDAGLIADDAASLAVRASRDGLSYGDYWWARYERKQA